MAIRFINDKDQQHHLEKYKNQQRKFYEKPRNNGFKLPPYLTTKFDKIRL